MRHDKPSPPRIKDVPVFVALLWIIVLTVGLGVCWGWGGLCGGRNRVHFTHEQTPRLSPPIG